MAGNNNNGATMGWRVVGQTERSIINDAGRPEDVVIVSYQLADGTAGTVRIPRSAYSVDNVRAAVAAQAAVAAEVAGLSG